LGHPYDIEHASDLHVKWCQALMQRAGLTTTHPVLEARLFERNLVTPLSDDVGQRNRLVLKMQLGKLLQTMTVQAEIEHIGHQQGIVEGAHADSALCEDDPGEF